MRSFTVMHLGTGFTSTVQASEPATAVQLAWVWAHAGKSITRVPTLQWGTVSVSFGDFACLL